MDCTDHITEHQKWKHLRYEDYVLIQIRTRDNWSPYRIAREIGCAPNTVRNILKKGMTPLYNGKVHRFKAKTGWKKYLENRSHCGRKYDALEKTTFLRYVKAHFYDEHWSLDACVGHAACEGAFQRSEMVCTKSLYNYVDLGLIGIKNIDLPDKMRRNTKQHRVRVNKRVLGRSIEDRPESVQSREEFGNWETDLVIGSKSKEDSVLLTLTERKTRVSYIMRLPDKTPESVMDAFQRVKKELGDKFSQVFRTITTDNGSEFAKLSELEADTQTLVYFTHPYTSCEKGSVENFNGLIRRFIRKGKSISSYSDEDIRDVQFWANGLPRKILGYRTPDEAFDEEMDKLYAA